jgi:AraC-like DNA-binding protein
MKGVLSQHDELFRYDYLYEKTPAANDFFCHFHNEYELLLFQSGNANFNIDNKIFPLRKNDLLIIHPAQYHKLCILSSMPYTRHVFNFQRRILSAKEIETLKNAAPIYHIESDSLIANAFATLKACEAVYATEDFEQLKELTLHSILMNLQYLPKTEENFHQPHTRMDDMLDFINEHIEEPLNAQILADNFFISKSSVDRAFVEKMQISCKRYINKKKILHAQTLISEGVPALKAAQRCSYESYTTFFRQYKTILGIPPIQDKETITD